MKKILFFLASVALLASCSNNEEMEGVINTGSVQTFDVNVAPFVGDDGTRTNIGNGTNITWSAGDQLGIWPKQVAGGQLVQQLQFNIVGSDANKATARFTGTGWGMITDGSYTYYANYPYATGAQAGEIEFSLKNGLSQNDLGKNDVAWAAPITPTAPEGVNFTFKHLGTLVKFVVTLPADADGVEFSSLKLYSNENIFTKTITYNPAEAVAEGETPTLTAKEKTNMLSVSLGNVVPQEHKISAYVLALPSEIANKSFDVELTPAEGNLVYVAHITVLDNWNKGKLKTYSVGATRVDMGTDLSVNANGETETANCYIISHAGAYNFIADVKGNGVVPTLEGLGAGDAFENVKTIDLTGAKVEVLWETVNTTTTPAVGTVIKSASLYHNRIAFSTPDEFTKGNALISVKNASGTILWSWHIWATDAPQAKVYTKGTMMDRNLGALCNNSTETEVGKVYGFHYQWGRPFPIVIDTKQATTLARTGTWQDNSVTTTSGKGTLIYSRQNPTTFIRQSSENTATGNWYWGSLPLIWTAEKNMYDPCPIGWRVPTGTSIWEYSFNSKNTTWMDAACAGRISTEDSSIFYPACANRNGDGVLTTGGTLGNYWSSATYSETDLRCSELYFNASNASKNPRYRSHAISIRPEKDE